MIMRKEIKESIQATIRRSQINLNPINPKRHKNQSIATQKKNILKVGYLGGIVYNRVTGNLIDGHRRVLALDLIHKYDGTPATDYDIRVEVVELDVKTEKEQLTYMAKGNTKADNDLIAKYIKEIDADSAGLSGDELKEILSMADVSIPEIESFDDMIMSPEAPKKSAEEKKAHMRDVKQQVREQAKERSLNEGAYITLSFSSYDAKCDFCDLIGISGDEFFAKGEDVISLIQ